MTDDPPRHGLRPGICRGLRHFAAASRRVVVACVLGLGSTWCMAVPGLVGTYFNNKTLTGPPALVRVDSTVPFDWGNAAPDPAVTADNFSVRWVGTVRVQTSGNYTFQTISDDGVRLSVNNTLVINNWTDHAATTNNSAAIALTAGVDYPLTLEFYENGGLAVMKLNWQKPGDSAFSSIPASNGTLGLSTALAPMLEYRFEQIEWSGTSGEVLDTSGNAFHAGAASLAAPRPTTATTSPAVAGSPGTCGYGVFNRTNKDYVALPAAFPNLGAAGSFSITTWIRTTNNSAAGQRIFADDENGYGGTSTGFVLSLGDRGSGKLNFLTRGTTAASDEAITPAVINNNTWYFVSFGVDYTAKTKFLKVYDASGTLLANVSTTYSQANIGSDSGIVSIGGESNAAGGSENTASFGFAGNIDEVRAFPFVLSATELNTVRTLTAACPVFTAPTLVAEYRFEEFSWDGSAGELKDTAAYAGGPYNGAAGGSPLATRGIASPARSGDPGTCGYASLPGPQANGGNFVVNSLPVSTTAGAQTTLAFWMYWAGTDSDIVVGWNGYDLWLTGGAFGFNTNSSDVFGIASTGLANGWHHVMAVFTNGSVTANRLYLDGVAQALSQRINTPNLGNAVVATSLRIGGYGASTSFRFSGRLDEVRVYNGGATASTAATLYTQTHACPGPHHLEIRHASGSGLTCTPSTLTLAACMDSSCATPYTTGVTGTVTATGAGMTVNWPSGAAFSIPAGSSTVTQDMQLTTAGSVVLGTSGVVLAPGSATTCNFGSPSCTFTAADAGLRFAVPSHRAEVSNTVNVTAVRKSDNSALCVPAFANVSRSVNFKCSYLNPTTGTQPVRVGGVALNSGNNAAAACDATGNTVSLAFDGTGKASTSVIYADAGKLTLTGSYTGSSGSEVGLVMTGSDSFTVAPASFSVYGIPSGTLVAGTAFSATVAAKNNIGNTTPNFGREASPESATLGFVRTQPTGTGAWDGSFSGNLGSFASGVATASNLKWTEVGQGNVTATLTSGSYLASSMNVTGTSSSAAGPFKPHHFDVAVSAACGAFSYAAQPFGVTVTARNAGNATTVNYDGTAATTPNFAKATTLSDVPVLGVGSWTSNSVAASAFTAGVATATPSYAFTTKTTAPQTLVLRAIDSSAVSSLGFAEGSTPLRSGRLKLSNAFGSEKAALLVPVQAQHWSGIAWIQNSADNCTSLPVAAVVRAGYLDARGVATTAWASTASALTITSGAGTLSFGAPLPTSTGSLDFALNLGAATTDQSCLATHPTSTGAALPWLRSQNGSSGGCAALWDRDPSARASFGIYSPETRKTVHARELF